MQKEPKEIRYERSLSARELRGLSHPLRFRILELLREGPATASMLGRELGESSGATSYHLRFLARMGMIEEMPDEGTRRERWWRRTERIVLIQSAREGDPEYEAAGARMFEMFYRRDEQSIEHWLRIRDELPYGLREAAFVGGVTVHVTEDELRELAEEAVRLFDRYRRPAADRPAGTVRAYVTFRALPQEKPGS